MAKKQMYLLDFFLIWLTDLPFSRCKGGDTRFLHCWAKTTPLFWGTGLLFLLFLLTRKLGGVTKRYLLNYGGSVLFPMLYGYYCRVLRR